MTPKHIGCNSIVQIPLSVDSSLPGQAICASTPTARSSAPHDTASQCVPTWVPRVIHGHQRTARVSEASALTKVASPAEHLAIAEGADDVGADLMTCHRQHDLLQ